MKKISLIFKDDRMADAWLAALNCGLGHVVVDGAAAATIKVSTRKGKKGKAV